jgi:hypothetical protein
VDVAEIRFDLLDAGLRSIRENPDEWYQGLYRCESGMCYAGHIAQAAGLRWTHPERATSADVFFGTDEMHVEEAVIKVTGITEEHATALFEGSNSLDDLEAMVGALKEKPDLGMEDLVEVTGR